MTASCSELTINFDLPVAASFRLIDQNDDSPALLPVTGSRPELDITRPAGKSTYVYHLADRARTGTHDTVAIWSGGADTGTLATAQVPVNCAIAPAQSITQTPDVGTPQITAVPASSNTNLANTGVPVWMVWALALAVVALVLGTVFVLFGGPHRRHAGSPPS